MKAACRLHDRVNLWALPILGLSALAGLFGWTDPSKVTNMFLMYIVADFLWIWLEPDALPSLPKVILGHHVVTFVLLLFPLRFPAYAICTCLDGITEINTFFLIARRQWRSQKQLLNTLYWATFFPLRMVLYPGLIFYFWQLLAPFPLYERLTVVVCQTLLVAFNIGMLTLSVRRRGKGSQVNLAAQSGAVPDKLAKAAEQPACNIKARAA